MGTAIPRTTITRLPEHGVHDLAQLHSLLEEATIGHIGLVADGHPVVIPTAVARLGDALLAHGSTGSRWMRILAEGADASVAVTMTDGVVVARSAFESSLHDRSAVLFGRFTALAGDEKERGLDALVDALIPGRRSEVRPSTKKELAATLDGSVGFPGGLRIHDDGRLRAVLGLRVELDGPVEPQPDGRELRCQCARRGIVV